MVIQYHYGQIFSTQLDGKEVCRPIRRGPRIYLSWRFLYILGGKLLVFQDEIFVNEESEKRT